VALTSDTEAGATNIQVTPPSVQSLTDVPQVFSQSEGAGTAAENQSLILTSGATNSQDNAAIIMQGAAGDNSQAANITLEFGDSATITFDQTGSFLDSWHDMSLSHSWSIGGGGFARYRSMPDRTVLLHGSNLVPGTLDDNTAIWTIPSGYRPASGATFNVCAVWTVGSSTTPALKSTPQVYVEGSALAIQGFMSNLADMSFMLRYPLD
jgi:hypothetical protein